MAQQEYFCKDRTYGSFPWEWEKEGIKDGHLDIIHIEVNF